jgi:hypothetical protein
LSLRAHIIHLLTTRRYSLAHEKDCQAEIADVLEASGLPFRREVHLGPDDIIDFMVESVGIEVKIKGARRAIFRQVERYCGYAELSEIILATNVPMNLPHEINGKPTAIAALGRGWL